MLSLCGAIGFITGDLSPLGTLIIIALMFIGCIGPIIFGLALLSESNDTAEADDIAI